MYRNCKLIVHFVYPGNWIKRILFMHLNEGSFKQTIYVFLPLMKWWPIIPIEYLLLLSMDSSTNFIGRESSLYDIREGVGCVGRSPVLGTPDTRISPENVCQCCQDPSSAQLVPIQTNRYQANLQHRKKEKLM